MKELIVNKSMKTIGLSFVLISTFLLNGCGNSKVVKKENPKVSTANCDISGIVTNIGPLKDAEVSIFNDKSKIGAVSTDANGRYRFKSTQANCDRGIVSGGIDLGLESGEQDDRTFDDSVTFAITDHINNVAVVSTQIRSSAINCDITNLTINDKLYYVFAKEIMQNIGLDDAKAKEIAALGLPCSNLATSSVGRYNKQLIIEKALEEMVAENMTVSQRQVNLDVLNKVLGFYETELAKNTDIARAAVHTVADAVDYLAEHSVNGDTNSNHPQHAIFTTEDVYLLDKLLVPENITAIETAIATKPDASRTRFGHTIAATFIDTKTLEDSGVNQGISYNIPVAPDPSPKIDKTCMASTTPAVCRKPTDDKFLVAVDYDDVNYTNSQGMHQRGGVLLYQATAENGISIIRHVNSNDDAKNDIERVDIYRKFIVLNDAAKALDIEDQYDLIKDEIKDLFTLDVATFKLDQDRFTSPKTLLLTLVADFNDLKGQSEEEYHEYATVSFPVIVSRDDATETLTFTIPENTDAVFTAKENGQNPIILKADSKTTYIKSKKDGVSSYNIGELYTRMIAKINTENKETILRKIKSILVKHATNYTNVKIYATMNELEPGYYMEPKNNFVRNPGTFNPADFALTSNASANIYKDVFTSANTTNQNGSMNSLNFRVILENPVEN